MNKLDVVMIVNAGTLFCRRTRNNRLTPHGDPRGQPTGWGAFGVFWVAEGPPERGGRAPVLRLRQGVDGRPARENFGFQGLWGVPRRPQLASRGSCAAHLRSPGAAPNSKIMPSCAVFFFLWRRCVCVVRISCITCIAHRISWCCVMSASTPSKVKPRELVPG